jgi:hypothetical protein
MASWSRDCDPNIKVTFLGSTRNGEDGASYVSIYAYEGAIRAKFPIYVLSWYSLPSSTSSANEFSPYFFSNASESC